MTCCICYENNELLKINCNHNVCKKCVKNMFNTKCPICRKDLIKELPIKYKTIILKKNIGNTEYYTYEYESQTSFQKIKSFLNTNLFHFLKKK